VDVKGIFFHVTQPAGSTAEYPGIRRGWTPERGGRGQPLLACTALDTGWGLHSDEGLTASLRSAPARRYCLSVEDRRQKDAPRLIIEPQAHQRHGLDHPEAVRQTPAE
jgi:hypothetical protein